MVTEESTEPMTLDGMKGKFVDSLLRNNKKIRSDRAIAIVETAEMIYKRKVEDLRQEIKQLKRTRENMLDLSPTTADSLTLADNFSGDEFVQKDIALGVKIREKEITLEIAQSQYNALFTEGGGAK